MLYSNTTKDISRLNKGTVDVIIPSSKAPSQLLAWSLLSFLLRTNPSKFNRIIVCLNDNKRESLTEKDNFLRDINDISDRITVIQVNTHSEHSCALETGLIWSRSEFYLQMHDDIIVLKDWSQFIPKDPKLGFVTTSPRLNCGLHENRQDGHDWECIQLPHPNGSFLFSSRVDLIKSHTTWLASCIHKPVVLTQEQLDVLNTEHEPHDHSPIIAEKRYDRTCAEMGAYIYYALKKAGHNFYTFPEGVVHHFSAGTWLQHLLAGKIEAIKPEILKLEQEISESPYRDSYERLQRQDDHQKNLKMIEEAMQS